MRWQTSWAGVLKASNWSSKGTIEWRTKTRIGQYHPGGGTEPSKFTTRSNMSSIAALEDEIKLWVYVLFRGKVGRIRVARHPWENGHKMNQLHILESLSLTCQVRRRECFLPARRETAESERKSGAFHPRQRSRLSKAEYKFGHAGLRDASWLFLGAVTAIPL